MVLDSPRSRVYDGAMRIAPDETGHHRSTAPQSGCTGATSDGSSHAQTVERVATMDTLELLVAYIEAENERFIEGDPTVTGMQFRRDYDRWLYTVMAYGKALTAAGGYYYIQNAWSAVD